MVSHGQKCLKPAQKPVGAPVLCQLTCGTGQVTGVHFKLAFKALEKRECIGRGAGKPGQNAILVQTPHLACVGFHDGVAKRDLAIAGNHDLIAASDRNNGCSAVLFHDSVGSLMRWKVPTWGRQAYWTIRVFAWSGHRALAAHRPQSLFLARGWVRS